MRIKKSPASAILRETMPHSLRLSIFFLRVAIGVNFFYLGWITLFSRASGSNPRDDAMSSLYHWLTAPNAIPWLPTVAAWVLLAAGGALILGFFTRLASFLAIALILASYLPTITFTSFNLSQLINNELITFFCLLVIIFGKAGHYLAVDKFTRWSRKRHKE
jgi:uncharacterized membrane protein YphA (DoxX/SURF4 family)